MKSLKKMCAVCGDVTQANVVVKFLRYRDYKLFHVCAYCAEHNLLKDPEELIEFKDDGYTSYTKIPAGTPFTKIISPKIRRGAVKA